MSILNNERLPFYQRRPAIVRQNGNGDNAMTYNIHITIVITAFDGILSQLNAGIVCLKYDK